MTAVTAVIRLKRRSAARGKRGSCAAYRHLTNKSSPGDEIPQRDVTYLLSVYLFPTGNSNSLLRFMQIRNKWVLKTPKRLKVVRFLN